MSMLDRVESLKAKHESLETLIEKECLRPLPDGPLVAQLKREKLRIKDEINRIIHH